MPLSVYLEHIIAKPGEKFRVRVEEEEGWGYGGRVCMSDHVDLKSF